MFPSFLNCFCMRSDFEAWYPRAFGCFLFFASMRERLSDAGVPTFIIPLLSYKQFCGHKLVNIRKVMVYMFSINDYIDWM